MRAMILLFFFGVYDKMSRKQHFHPLTLLRHASTDTKLLGFSVEHLALTLDNARFALLDISPNRFDVLYASVVLLCTLCPDET